MIRILVTIVLLCLAYNILAVSGRGILRYIRKTVQGEITKNTSLSGEARRSKGPGHAI